jgi:hypothetical protein
VEDGNQHVRSPSPDRQMGRQGSVSDGCHLGLFLFVSMAGSMLGFA